MIRIRSVLFITGILGLALGGCMIVPLAISVTVRGPDMASLAFSSLISLLVGGGCLLFAKGSPQDISHREGFLIVGLGWLIASILGALPFWFHGVMSSFVDAFFESASGFTTTGATVLSDIEELPRGILFWRSMSQWLGGMGIILMSLAILPLLGIGGMQLYKAEVPGPVPDKLKPRISETAKALWQVYLLFTALETTLLLLSGLSPFDAICHTFTTLATGGYSTRALSIESFHSGWVEMVILFFMLIAGVNFTLHYRALTGKPGSYFKNTEFRFFLGVFLAMTVVTAIQLVLALHLRPDLALRHAAFQVGSILTTTGFTSTDYEKWPAFSQTIIFFLMFIGGSAGSTGGGIKCMRILILLKSGRRELVRLIHPHAVVPVKLGGQTVPQDVVESIWGFLALFVGIFTLASLVLALLGLDIVSAFASVAACISNIGPGLGSVGPTDNYAHVPALGKWILSVCMIIGRLEVYTLILLLVPEFWKK